ncbi:hypothetical protein BT63DRAFT_409478 [Microthyrium microscopicum]|uniref:Transcription factor domain-containing protein n=1 Tax=Microthyrium microscopicum TaxID=703497 RepID=A0A6A6UWD8_9PEZI|nr:hypothetical protein BT63DRAFT_409478 [Microthyrium microscopicum]
MKALRQLNFNLGDPKLSQHPTNIAVALLLGIYELTNFENGNGWIQHAGGVGKLIETRGADSLNEGPARFYYKLSRIPIITHALIMRKRTFLEAQVWRSITSTVESPFIKSSFALVDIMAHIPGICEDSDMAIQALNSGLVPSTVPETLEKRIIEVFRQLFSWRWTWEYWNSNLVYEIQVDPKVHFTVDDEKVPLFQTIYFCRHFHRGKESVLYNTALLLLFDLTRTWSFRNCPAQALEGASLAPSGKTTNPLRLPHAQLSSQEVSDEVCQSLEWFLQGPERMSGVINMIFPIRILSDALPEGKKRRWLLTLLERMGVSEGFQFTKRLHRRERIVRDLNQTIDI